MPTRLQHLDRLLARLGFVHVAVQQDRFDDLVADGVHRAERGHRLLEDHGDLAAADGAHLAAVWVQLGQVDRFRSALPPFVPAARWKRICPSTIRPGRVDQLQDRVGRDALAAAAFAHHAERPAARHHQVDAIDRFDHAFIQEEIGLQAFDFEEEFIFISSFRSSS